MKLQFLKKNTVCLWCFCEIQGMLIASESKSHFASINSTWDTSLLYDYDLGWKANY